MKRQKFSSTQSLASQSSKGSYGKRSARTKGTAQRSLVTKSRAASIPRWGFPSRLYIAHKYVGVGSGTLTSTTGSNVGYVVTCNGMFDPDVTGTGHQPMYFDNCSAIYNHYTVVKSTIKWTIIPTALYAVGCAWATYIDDDTSGVASTNAAGETQGGAVRIAPGGISQPLIFYQNWNAYKAFGGNALGNDNLQGSSSANPTELQTFCLFGNALNVSTQIWNVTFEVVYYAIWDELKTQSEN